jgi:hypothetical protein
LSLRILVDREALVRALVNRDDFLGFVQLACLVILFKRF